MLYRSIKQEIKGGKCFGNYRAVKKKGGNVGIGGKRLKFPDGVIIIFLSPRRPNVFRSPKIYNKRIKISRKLGWERNYNANRTKVILGKSVLNVQHIP